MGNVLTPNTFRITADVVRKTAEVAFREGVGYNKACITVRHATITIKKE